MSWRETKFRARSTKVSDPDALSFVRSIFYWVHTSQQVEIQPNGLEYILIFLQALSTWQNYPRLKRRHIVRLLRILSATKDCDVIEIRLEMLVRP